MQIKIEIDVRPEELRRFIGLPDVTGLQDDVIHFVREKLQQAGESFDAAAFVKGNLKLLSRSPILGKWLTAARPKSGDGAVGDDASANVLAEGLDALAAAAEEGAMAAPAPVRSRKARAARKKPRTQAGRKRAAAGKRARRRPAVAEE